MEARRPMLIAAGITGYGVLVTMVERYQFGHDGLKAFSLSSSLGLLVLIASVALGWFAGRWWAVLAGMVALPELLALRAWTDSADAFHVDSVTVLGHAAYLGVFIGLGVMTRVRDALGRAGATGRRF